MDLATLVLGVLLGALFVWVSYSVYGFGENWLARLKIRRLSPKVGDMYATYNIHYVENWMKEDYSELFIVKNVGKKYVRLESIDDKRMNPPGTGRCVDVEILQLSIRYHKYQGTKNKKTMYDDILGD